MKIIFWNVCKKDSNVKLLLKHAKKHNIDIVLVCEMPLDHDDNYEDYELVIQSEKFNDVFAYKRKSINLSSPCKDNTGYSTFILDSKKLNIFAVHFNSKTYQENEHYSRDQVNDLTRFVPQIEKDYSSRSVVIGDFNANILDSDIFSKETLGVTYFKKYFKKCKYKFNEKEKDFFYSPSLDTYCNKNSSRQTPATYYYDSGLYKWAFIDNLLLNFDAYKKYVKNSFKIVYSLCDTQLVSNGKILNQYSDHLPIYFEIR